MKKLSENWLKLAIYGTLIFTILLIVLLHLFSPTTFITEIVNENGEILRIYNFEKLFDRIIDCIGALGAFIIGLIALDQSAKSHKLAEQSQQLAEQAHMLTELSQKQENDRDTRETSCNILLQNTPANYINDRHHHLNHANKPYPNLKKDGKPFNYIAIDFSNSSKPFLSSYAIFWGKEMFFMHEFVLGPNATKSGYIVLPENLDLSNPKARFNIMFCSCYGKKTYGSFQLYSTSEKKDQPATNNVETKQPVKYNIGRYQFYGTNSPHEVKIPESEIDLFN